MTELIQDLDQKTLDNIAAARTYKDLPPDHYQVPYHNVGNLLEMRARETPDKTFLICCARPMSM